MLPFSFIGGGTYTNSASPTSVNIILNDRPDFFKVTDLTNWGANAAGSYIAVPQMESFWYSIMGNGPYKQTSQIVALTSAAALQANFGASGGFTFIDSSNPPTFASLADTAIDKTTWVVLMANTGSISVGDTVRLINPLSMLQAGGISAQVTAVTPNVSITLGYIATAVTNGANFTADSTGGFILKYYRGRFYPRKLQIMQVTQAVQATVYFAEPNDFTPGEMVDFNVPTTYGMTQLSFLTKQPGGPARVLVSTNTATESSITLDLNTTGFTAFAYPTSAGSVGAASPPFCFPAGSGVVPFNGSATVPLSPPGTNLVDAFDNRNQFFMNLGSNVVGAASAVMQWEAFKYDFGNLSNA